MRTVTSPSPTDVTSACGHRRVPRAYSIGVDSCFTQLAWPFDTKSAVSGVTMLTALPCSIR